MRLQPLLSKPERVHERSCSREGAADAACLAVCHSDFGWAIWPTRKLTVIGGSNWPARADERRRFVAANLPLIGATWLDFRARGEGQQLAGTARSRTRQVADRQRSGINSEGLLALNST